MPAPTPRRASRLITAGMLLVVLGLPVGISSPAAGAQSSQVPAAEATREIAAGPVIGRTDERRYGPEFVNGQDVGEAIPISSSIDALVQFDTAGIAESGLTAFPGGVSCSRISDGETMFTQEQWNSPSPADRTMEAPSIDEFVVCASGDLHDGGLVFVGTRWIASWELVKTADGPMTAILGSPDQLTRSTVQLSYGSADEVPIRLRQGESIRIVGPAGTWPVNPAGRSTTFGSFSGAHGQTPIEVSVTADGTALDFTAPMLGLAENEARSGVLRMSATANEESALPFMTSAAHWVDRVVIADRQLATSTNIALGSSFALSSRPVKATAVVSATSGVAPSGSVSFLVDGREVRRVDLPAGPQAKVTVSLPITKRGLHTVVAVYNGSDDLQGSTSPTKRVRVLF